jgi:hypothetical protein
MSINITVYWNVFCPEEGGRTLIHNVGGYLKIPYPLFSCILEIEAKVPVNHHTTSLKDSI